jgi:DNA-binding beta-propeller fold protein YncE
MSLDGGRTLTWERNFSTDTDVKPVRGFWTKVIDFVAGAPDMHYLVNPYSVTTDSHGRILITDPSAMGIHIFDFAEHKYKFIQHLSRDGMGKNDLRTPQCIAVDATDNIYVTDSEAGVIFVFQPNGKFVRTIGSLKGGEGYFKRPTGIAVDSAAQKIYVTDTLKDKVFVLGMDGTILQSIGKSGSADGEFNLPTELRITGNQLLVVDAMNFRIQRFDLSGKFLNSIGSLGDSPGSFFRPKALSIDSEGHIYVVDSLWGMVQVFDETGQLLYHFGERGTHAGEFQLPNGMTIDRNDKVYVVDTFNRRVQIFQYKGVHETAKGELR